MDADATICRVDFLAACRTLRKLVTDGQLARSDLLVELLADNLRLSVAGVSGNVATSCPVQVGLIVNGTVLKTLQFIVRNLKTTEFALTITEDRVRVGPHSFLGRRVTPQGMPIHLPMNAPLRDVLALPYQYSGAEIERAGLTATVASALAKRDKAISNAADLLEPLGVTEQTLQDAVEDSLKRHAEQTL